MTVQRKQTGFTALKLILILTMIFVMAITSFFIYNHLHKSEDAKALASCQPTQAMIKSQMYSVPCSINFLVKGPPYDSEQSVANQMKPINGILNPRYPAAGIYNVKVKAGTEEKSIIYLKNQPNIKNVTQAQCCNVAN